MDNQSNGSSSSDNTEIRLLKDDSTLDHSFSQGEEIAKTIPLFAENFDVTKKTEETQLVLSKKWVDSTKKIEIPVKFEEFLINGKEFDHYNEKELTEILSKIKDKITHVFSHDDDKEKGKEGGSPSAAAGGNSHNSGSGNRVASPSDIEVREYSGQSPDEESAKDQGNATHGRKPVSLSIGDGNGASVPYEEKDDSIVIPLWGEEIEISKRMVKLGEIVVKKYEGVERRKIDVDVKTEKLTIKYPDKHKEEII
jgi:stress response protein YsnF